MTAMPQGPWTAPPPSRWGAGRVVALVLGLLLLLPALGLIAGGGVLLWVHHGNRTDGFVFSETDDFSTDGYALVSERIDLATGADWLPLSSTLGTARAELTGTDPGTEIFVGIAPLAEGSAYLDGVERSVIDDLGTTATDESPVPGGAPSGPPADQDFWVAQTEGTGMQRLDWEPAEGNWLFVAMNADGSAGVSVETRIGATVPALDGLAWGILATGLVLLLIGLLVLALALRRPVLVGPVAGGPGPGAPPWTPPAPVDRSTAADDRPGTATSAPWRPPTS